MKWPIFFSGVAIIVVAGLCYRFLPSKAESVAREPSDQTESVGTFKPVPNAAASTPFPKALTPIPPREKVTNDRRRVFDSPDIMATINDIRRHGTPDEKDWALYLLSSCLSALGRTFTGTPLSDYERLDACAVGGWCGSRWGGDAPASAPAAAVSRLIAKYTAAVNARMDARSILAIR
jgi:hypothetical protein